MVRACWVNGCANQDGERSYYYIPKVLNHLGEHTRELSERRRREWLAAINRKDTPYRHAYVCSDHFISGKPSTLYEVSHPDWVPSLLMSEADRKNQETQKEKAKRRFVRYERTKNREKVLQSRNASKDACQDDSSHVSRSVSSVLLKDALQDSTCEEKQCDNKMCVALKEDYQRLLVENCNLKERLKKLTLDENSLAGKDGRVKFFTGLNSYMVLITLFNFLEPHIPLGGMSQISKFQKLLLTLMKLRLSCHSQDLAYRFGISISAVSRVFKTVVHVIYTRCKKLVLWPDRDSLRMTMPMSFRKNFGLKVSCVIDCFEIFIERPSNLMARAQTWSQYKHHNTVKYLIGITPQGVISFISKGYGGRVSDKYITEDSGFLNNLLPGDLILADRGFNISDSVGLMCAEVKIPAFMHGKKQLSAWDVESTRKIAHSRVHVERLIGLARNKYTLLRDIIPIDFLITGSDDTPLLDKIVHIACALTNCCESIIPFE